jgi:hypothetical protein
MTRVARRHTNVGDKADSKLAAENTVRPPMMSLERRERALRAESAGEPSA